MQTLFLQGPSVTLRTLVLVIASIGLMVLDHRGSQLEVVRNTLTYALYPLQYTIDLPIRLYYWGDETLSTHKTLLNEKRRLEDFQLLNKVRLQKLDILEKENRRLRKLLHATPKTGEKILIAEIINVDINPYRQLTVINKGSNDEVYISQPIIDAQGVIGQTIHVNANSSTAMLITDASHALPVQVDRTGLRAVAFGTGKIEHLDLRHIPHNADIRIGDTLITSGLGGRFPANYPVAVITHIERSPDEAFVSVDAEPLALLDRSREVLLVWHNQPQTELSGDDEP
ncbi:MAG: rod shape-determining protein MreC [Gammaproteobacteria bacterium]|nr:rod shape-determining protein MreC [Gammaproteobacteria bacterium]MCW8923158.1 rod shape-determining protein MreC [Gammaproteobacteria bacterium]